MMVQTSTNPDDLGNPIDLLRLAIALWQRRRIIAITTILGMVVGGSAAKTLAPATFEAQCVVECDRCSSQDFGDRELATLQESVKLPRHIEEARTQLGLHETIEEIGRSVDVSASIESRIIRVTARGKSGDEAADLANGIIRSFLETRLEIERDKLDNRAHTLHADADQARRDLLEARARYDQFRRDNNIADLPAERQAAIQETARLRSEAAIAHADERSEHARLVALRRASSKEPSTTILQQNEDMPDARRLAEVKAELTAARAHLTSEHPRVLALAAEVEALERKVMHASETVLTGRTVGGNPQWLSAQQGILHASAGQQAADLRRSTYESLAEKAAQSAARLSDIEGRASELLSNLQNAERHAASIELDLKAAEDTARNPSTGLRILARATPPQFPIKSSRRIIALLGPLLAALLASLAVVWRELRGLRIHTATELAYWGKGPVVASSRWPRVGKEMDELLAELDGALQSSTGTTLFVGMGPREVAYLKELKKSLRGRERCSFDVSRARSNSALRRAARLADRTVVVVCAAQHSAPALRAFAHRIALPNRIGYILIDVRDDLNGLLDLSGNLDAFWQARTSTTQSRSNRKRGLRLIGSISQRRV